MPCWKFSKSTHPRGSTSISFPKNKETHVAKALKWIGIAVGAFVVIAGLVAVYIASTFNPNDYKANIIRAVQEKTGRTLQLKGDLKLAFYPSIGAKLGEASLSEPKS